MKVIILGDAIATQRAGIHYYGKQLVREMMGRYPQHQYSIILPQPMEDLELTQIIIPMHASWHLRYRQLVSIPRRVNAISPDLVIELAHFGPFRLDEHIRRVTVIHDLTPILLPRFHGFISVMMHRLLLPGILKRASFVIVNSLHTEGDLLRQFPQAKGKTNVFYPSVSEQPHPFEGLAKRYAVSRRPYFLTVGTIEPRKNHLGLLKAFEIFCRRNKSHDLLIVGQKGWKNRSFFTRLKESPMRSRIRVLEYINRSELWEVYRQADVFVYPSMYEGFGLPVLEAMSLGLPLIVADNTSLREIAEDAALLFDAADHHALSMLMAQSIIPSENQKLRALSEKQYHRIERRNKSLAFLD